MIAEPSEAMDAGGTGWGSEVACTCAGAVEGVLGARTGGEMRGPVMGAVDGTAVQGPAIPGPAKVMDAGGVAGRTGGMVLRAEVVGRADAVCAVDCLLPGRRDDDRPSTNGGFGLANSLSSACRAGLPLGLAVWTDEL